MEHAFMLTTAILLVVQAFTLVKWRKTKSKLKFYEGLSAHLMEQCTAYETMLHELTICKGK